MAEWQNRKSWPVFQTPVVGHGPLLQRSGFSAHQRVFGSSLRLPGSLLSDDPMDRQLLTADPYTDFQQNQ